MSTLDFGPGGGCFGQGRVKLNMPNSYELNINTSIYAVGDEFTLWLKATANDRTQYAAQTVMIVGQDPPKIDLR